MHKSWTSTNPDIYFNIICDFDGTVTPIDTTDLILSRFAPSQWEDIEAQWQGGLISSRECLYQQICLLKTNEKTLNDLVDAIPLAGGFEEFVSFARQRGLKFRIVSDGLDYVIRRILGRRDFSDIPVTANHLKIADGSFSLEFPHLRSTCGSGVCKCAAALKVPQAGQRMILIGDGRSDICLAEQADFVLARRGFALEGHCLDKGRPYIGYDNFFNIIDFFEKELPGSLDLSRPSLNPARPTKPLAASLETKQ